MVLKQSSVPVMPVDMTESRWSNGIIWISQAAAIMHRVSNGAKTYLNAPSIMMKDAHASGRL